MAFQWHELPPSSRQENVLRNDKNQQRINRVLRTCILGFIFILWRQSIPPKRRATSIRVDLLASEKSDFFVRSKVFAAVTMKKGVLWDATPCGFCKNRRFGGT
jgi:hypothetical protein